MAVDTIASCQRGTPSYSNSNKNKHKEMATLSLNDKYDLIFIDNGPIDISSLNLIITEKLYFLYKT